MDSGTLPAVSALFLWSALHRGARVPFSSHHDPAFLKPGGSCMAETSTSFTRSYKTSPPPVPCCPLSALNCVYTSLLSAPRACQVHVLLGFCCSLCTKLFAHGCFVIVRRELRHAPPEGFGLPVGRSHPHVALYATGVFSPVFFFFIIIFYLSLSEVYNLPKSRDFLRLNRSLYPNELFSSTWHIVSLTIGCRAGVKPLNGLGTGQNRW